MAIEGIERFSQTVHQRKADHDKQVEGPLGQKVSDLAHQKKLQNAAILEANASVSLQSGNNALSLVYKAALEKINDVLQEATGEENAIQVAVDEGIDVSPEATAQRILSFATGYFDQFKENHKDLEDDAARSQFVDLIKGGIEQGFTEARDILDGLKVLEGDVADNVDKTYQLIMNGLDQFLNGNADSEEDIPEVPEE